jgi:chromosome segregation ATPase
VHGVITYAEAMKESTDPEDLSLKLRKMFPGIEERGGEMNPSTADFSEILMLQQYRKLYEEQEEKTRMRIVEKDERIADLEAAIGARDNQLKEIDRRLQEGHQEVERMRGDYNRLRSEAQEKIDKLMERIKELNNRLMGNGGGDGEKKSR